MSSIFLIWNETTFTNHDGVVSDAVSAHATMSLAMDEIQALARDHGVIVEPDATGVYLPSHSQSHIDTDEYYIREMELQHG